MKRLSAWAAVLAVGLFFFVGANQCSAGQSEYNSRGGEGVLRMKHSVTLGINIPIAVWIDGEQAGVFARGHVYERTLSPGRHTVYASRPSRASLSWYGAIDVRPGETLSFVVSTTPAQVILTPVNRID